MCPGGSDNFTVWVTGEAFSSLTTDPLIKITTLVYPLEPRDTVLLEESYLRSPLSKKTASQDLRYEAPNPCTPASCHTAAHMTSLGLSSKTKQVHRTEAGPREAWQRPPCFPGDPEPRPQHSAPHHSRSQMRGVQATGAGATPCVQDPQQCATEATAGAGSALNLYRVSQHTIAKYPQRSQLQSTSQLAGVVRGPELQQHMQEDTLRRLQLNTITEEKE